MPSLVCDACRHPESEHHLEREHWLSCFHPGCSCESYKGQFYWNDRRNNVSAFLNDRESRLRAGQERYGRLDNADSWTCPKCATDQGTFRGLLDHLAEKHGMSAEEASQFIKRHSGSYL